MADATPTPEQLKGALKAFKKRLKLTQLEEDSRLGKSPLTGGHAKILAINAPNQFPLAVWEELVKQGKLKHGGQGMYELVEQI